MLFDSKWYWFGVLVDASNHVKLRQYHLRFSGFNGRYQVFVLSKGISGKLWHVRQGQAYATDLNRSIEMLKGWIDQWADGYVVIDEGMPLFSYERAWSQPSGAANPCWWADILGVPSDSSEDEVKSAWRQRARETHPDKGGDADEFRRMYAAYEFIKTQKGWS